jgi:signal transduction histidine kinase
MEWTNRPIRDHFEEWPMRVLVVEDEKKTASFVRKALQAEGFAVDVCHNGGDALAAARATPFDGIVLDIMLPGRDGLSVLCQLREHGNLTPALLLSARGEVNERVEGLNAGADDYLLKPFELAELVARVRASTRRGGETKSTALRDESLSATERERAASLLDELRRFARIVDGLTLLAKADAGQVALTPEPVRLDELVRDNSEDAQILAEPHNIQVELAGGEEITVRGDRHRLRQLLLNLADSAVKYNQPQGRVTMSLRRADGVAEFTITNAGLGIPPEILPRVFDRFFRGDPAHSPAVDGCGLGLSIAQWIVSAHGGTIKIESALEKLTTVTVRVPLTPANKPVS